jgi:transposase, IS5 family
VGAPGIPIWQGLNMLILQFMEDYSDRQMERAVRENIAVKWFSGYELPEITPDHSYFGKLRKRLGTKSIARLFTVVVSQLEKAGLVGNLFQFVDASIIVSKAQTWRERDRAVKDDEDGLNNKNIGKYAKDPEARFGCKGKNKYFFGYKRHVSADMRHGIITKVAVTPGNVTDSQGMPRVLRKPGMAFLDKGYCGKAAAQWMRIQECHNGAIKKQNMKDKNRDRDRWLSSVRMPYESVFSKQSKRSRYRGTRKVQFQAFMQALVHNIKRWVKVTEIQATQAPLCLVTG